MAKDVGVAHAREAMAKHSEITKRRIEPRLHNKASRFRVWDLGLRMDYLGVM